MTEDVKPKTWFAVSNDASSAADRDFRIYWKDLTVRGYASNSSSPSTLGGAFTSTCKLPVRLARAILPCISQKAAQTTILSKISGSAQAGEMILVLGKPGSGCSRTSFLKTITGHTTAFSSIDGTTSYAGLERNRFEKLYPGELLYNHEADNHHPSLSVEQILRFAASARLASEVPEGKSRRQVVDEAVQLVLDMFNLDGVRHTLIGNAHIRGLSGGERKRVSIAEMMIAKAAVNAWDSPTRGLDAASAFDFVASLQKATRSQGSITFTTMYQASEKMFQMFDKVLVLDKGRQVYFGPVETAVAHFQQLGFIKDARQNSPDFLTGCADNVVRELCEEPRIGNLNAADLATLYDASPQGLLNAQQVSSGWKGSESESSSTGGSKSGQIEVPAIPSHMKITRTVPYHSQVALLFKRQFALRFQDRLLLFVSLFTTFAFGIVLGTLWLKQPKTAEGAFTRGGVLYISLLVNTGQAFGELAGAMLGRPLMNKHKDYGFHRPSALWMAQIAVDGCFASFQILVFSLLVYFLSGLALDAAAFFTFYLMIATAYITLTALFRALGCVSSDYDFALKLSASLLTLFVLVGGYFIQYHSEPIWLRWLYWLNPFALGFSSLMINEFRRISLHCTEETLVPNGSPSYSNTSYQSCLIQGAQPGQSEVSGTSYIYSAFEFLPDNQWRNFGILIALTIAFLVAQTICAETLFKGESFRHRHVAFAKSTSKKTEKAEKDCEKASSSDLHSDSVLTFSNLSYDVKIKSGDKRLLNEISGFVRPGQLTALMGASGAGKTTLLDVLSLRKTIGTISGQVLIDGKPLEASFRRRTAYAEQNDLHEPTQTVREAMQFAALMRQDAQVPVSEKLQHVEELIKLLELEAIADAVIGDSEGVALSMEQMKRLTIGVELSAKPDLLLFLDEPTTGLDSQSAFKIVRLLKKLASRGQAIVCTIHQPNSLVFASFDKLLLLQQGGECVYFGDIGPGASTLRDYFSERGANCPADMNVAEWMLDVIRPGKTSIEWTDEWRRTEQANAVKKYIEEIGESRSDTSKELRPGDNLDCATSIWYQIRICSQRSLRAFWRSPKYASTQLFNHMMVGLLTGLTFLNITDNPTSLQYRLFIIFQVTMLPTLIVAQIVPKFHAARAVFHREAAAGTYGSVSLAVSQLVADLPFSLLCATVFFLPLYFMPAFSVLGAGYQFGMIILTEIFSVTNGQLLAATTPSTLIALFINPFVTIAMTLFCGVVVPRAQMPAFWRAWLYPLNPFTYLVNGMAAVGLQDQPIACQSGDFTRIPIPFNQTCGQYMADFFAGGGDGYVLDAQAMGECLYCTFSSGAQYLDTFGIAYGLRFRQMGVFAAFCASNIVLFILAIPVPLPELQPPLSRASRLRFWKMDFKTSSGWK